jgi:hypothetical protein
MAWLGEVIGQPTALTDFLSATLCQDHRARNDRDRGSLHPRSRRRLTSRLILESQTRVNVHCFLTVPAFPTPVACVGGCSEAPSE